MRYPRESLLDIADPNECYTEFSSDLYLMYDTNFSLKSIRKKDIDIRKPCITREINELIRNKQILQIILNLRSIGNGDDYKIIRNMVKNIYRCNGCLLQQ